MDKLQSSLSSPLLSLSLLCCRSHGAPTVDGDCTSLAFRGEDSDSEADLTVCFHHDEEGGGTVNGNVMDHQGREYKIESEEDGSHLWFVVDVKLLEKMSNNLHDVQVGKTNVHCIRTPKNYQAFNYENIKFFVN